MNRIREIRKEKGLTAKYLALELGIAESTVSQYENSKREPDQNTLIQIADILGVSLDYLLCRSEQDDIKKQPPAQGEELDNSLISLLMELNPQDAQRVRDFVEGLKAARTE